MCTRRDLFTATCDELNLTQCVMMSTCGNNILDIVLLSHPEDLKQLDILPPIALDHYTLRLKLSYSNNKKIKIEHRPVRYDLTRASQQLLTVKWHLLFTGFRDVNETVTRFMNTLNSTISIDSK